MQVLAWTFSVLFHPTFLFLGGYILIMQWFPQYGYALDNRTLFFLGLSLLVYTVFIPFITLWVLKKAGKISSITLPKKEDRQWSYFYLALCYAFWYYQLYSMHMPGPALAYALGAVLMITFAFVANFFDKVSAHGNAWGGLWVMIMAVGVSRGIDVRWWLMVALLAGGITLSSRLWLKAHDPGQIWKGCLTGMAGMALAFAIHSL